MLPVGFNTRRIASSRTAMKHMNAPIPSLCASRALSMAYQYARIVVLDLVHPFLMHVALPRPSVLELGSGSQTVRRGVEVPAFVERRICGNQIHRSRIHRPQEVEIIAVEQRSVFPVRF